MSRELVCLRLFSFMLDERREGVFTMRRILWNTRESDSSTRNVICPKVLWWGSLSLRWCAGSFVTASPPSHAHSRSSTSWVMAYNASSLPTHNNHLFFLAPGLLPTNIYKSLKLSLSKFISQWHKISRPYCVLCCDLPFRPPAVAALLLSVRSVQSVVDILSVRSVWT